MIHPKSLKYAHRHARVAVALGVLVFASLALVWREAGGLVAWLAAAGAGLALLGVPAYLHLRLYARVVEADRQQRALLAVRPLLGVVPVPLGLWAIEPSLAELLVRLVQRERPGLIVECGSGASTVVMAAALRELGGGGRIVSLDHEQRYAEATRRLLRERGLESWAEIVVAPIQERDVEGKPMRWYAGGFEAALPGAIDLLVVDGPPKRTGPRARYPAVPLLRPYLADGCVIVMDDGDRRAERSIARAWARALAGSLEYVQGGRGGWLIRRGAGRRA